ncbi:MAG: DUF5043 domain-containing protein [Bacteroides sp.]|nr:DUF5043 domain-containing protein [Bacteroides sp.]
MKRLLLITALMGCIYPCMAQQDRIELQETLSETVIFDKTATFEREGYTYQCDVQYGHVTLYNKKDTLTYKNIVYRDTGKIFSCDFTENNVIEGNSKMSQKADAIVDRTFTKAMADEIGEHELMITMLLSPFTGKVVEVNFSFPAFSPYAKAPLHVYREIEVELKELIHFTPGEVGKQLNYIMLAWLQKPKGRLPEIHLSQPPH